MPKLPIISGKFLLKLLTNNGFLLIRQKGSHVFIENQDGSCRSVIPIHSNEDLGKGLLKKILNDLDISVETLIDWIK